MFRGYDLVTLAVVVPTLVVSSLLTARGSLRGQLFVASMFAYSAYAYALYVFGARFNDLFLVHVAVFSLSLFALIFVFIRLDAERIASTFRDRTPTRIVGGVLALLAVSLGAMWIISSVRFAVTGDVPQEASQLILPTEMTHLGYVLDLALLVPGYALAAVLLWRRAAWGYVLAVVLLISGTVHQLSYMAALLSQAMSDVPGATAFDPLEPVILAAYGIAAALLLGNMRVQQHP
jgi:hypothetical protein